MNETLGRKAKKKRGDRRGILCESRKCDCCVASEFGFRQILSGRGARVVFTPINREKDPNTVYDARDWYMSKNLRPIAFSSSKLHTKRAILVPLVQDPSAQLRGDKRMSPLGRKVRLRAEPLPWHISFKMLNRAN